jgi:hypothetical protein
MRGKSDRFLKKYEVQKNSKTFHTLELVVCMPTATDVTQPTKLRLIVPTKDADAKQTNALQLWNFPEWT